MRVRAGGTHTHTYTQIILWQQVPGSLIWQSHLSWMTRRSQPWENQGQGALKAKDRQEEGFEARTDLAHWEKENKMPTWNDLVGSTCGGGVGSSAGARSHRTFCPGPEDEFHSKWDDNEVGSLPAELGLSLCLMGTTHLDMPKTSLVLALQVQHPMNIHSPQQVGRGPVPYLPPCSCLL